MHNGPMFVGPERREKMSGRGTAFQETGSDNKELNHSGKTGYMLPPSLV